jgi:HK97 family phage portal protein
MFLSLNHAATGADRSPLGNFHFEPAGMRSLSGIRVTSTQAMRLSAVYSCVLVLAQSFAVLPIRLYRRKSNRTRELVTDHWLYRLLAKRPNRFQTPFEWKEMMMGHLALRGNAFNEIIANGRGEILELLPIHPDRIKMELLVNGSFRYLVTRANGTTDPVHRGAIWHVKGLSSDGYVGLNPIEQARDVLGLGLAAQSYGARFFANDARPGGWIELPLGGKFANDDEKAEWIKSWQRNQSGANRGRTAILENGMKYHQLEVNNADAQFLESRKFSRSEIASIFRVPPHKIMDLDRSTNNNIEHQGLEFATDTMTPIAERFESSIDMHLLPDDDPELEVEFDMTNLLRADLKARAEYFNKRFHMGSMSPNDICAAEGDEPVPGGDKYFVPMNLVSLDQAGKPQQKKGRQAPANDRSEALAKAAAERLARKEARGLTPLLETLPMPVDQVKAFLAKHVALVQQALSVSADAANAYLAARNADVMQSPVTEEVIYNLALPKLEALALKGHL